MNVKLFENYIEKCPYPDLYLKRIGYEEEVELSIEGLNRIIRAHQKTVPFENVGICDYGYYVKLDVDSLFQKIVVERKGGYCFENNASMASLLNALGFNVRPIGCRIMHNEEKINSISHRANIVNIDGLDYFVDVGIGGTEYHGAVPMKEGLAVESFNEEFSFRKCDDTWWELRTKSPYLNKENPVSEKREELSLLVGTHRCIPADFYAYSDYCCQNSESPFTKSRRVYIKTDTGFRRLLANTLTIIDKGKASVYLIKEKDIPDVLKKYFGLVYK